MEKSLNCLSKTTLKKVFDANIKLQQLVINTMKADTDLRIIQIQNCIKKSLMHFNVSTLHPNNVEVEVFSTIDFLYGIKDAITKYNFLDFTVYENIDAILSCIDISYFTTVNVFMDEIKDLCLKEFNKMVSSENFTKEKAREYFVFTYKEILIANMSEFEEYIVNMDTFELTLSTRTSFL